jgi:flagellar capping protein FliD
MQDLQTRYRAQFTAMDNLVNQLTATGNYLTQQFAAFSSSNNK